MLITNYKNTVLCEEFADLIISIFNFKTLPLLRVKKPTRNNKTNAYACVSYIAKNRSVKEALDYVANNSVKDGVPQSFTDVLNGFTLDGVRYYHGINASKLIAEKGGYSIFYDAYQKDEDLDNYLARYRDYIFYGKPLEDEKEEDPQDEKGGDEFLGLLNPDDFLEDAEDEATPETPKVLKDVILPKKDETTPKEDSPEMKEEPKTPSPKMVIDEAKILDETKKLVLKELETYRIVLNDDAKAQMIQALKGSVDEIVARVAKIQGTEKIVVYKGKEKKLPQSLYHKQFNQILNLIANKFNLYLYGEAGDGKSHLVKQCSDALGLSFYTQTPSDVIGLLGYNDIQGEFQETPFTLWVQNGGLLYLSEFDNVGDAILSINTALANGFITINKKRYNLHEDCVFVADGNTKGNGATSVYCGRNAIDGATLDRFLFVELQHDSALELALSGDNKEWIAFINSFRKVRDTKKIKCLATMRSTMMMAKLEAIGYPLKSGLQTCLLKGLSGEPLKTLANEVIVKLPDNKYAKALSEVAR